MVSKWHKKVIKATSRKLLLKEIEDCKNLGLSNYVKHANHFLKNNGSSGTKISQSYYIVHDGKEYPLKAISRMAALKGRRKQQKRPLRNLNPTYYLPALDKHRIGWKYRPDSDALDVAIKQLMTSILNTTSNSNGQTVSVIKKNTELKLTKSELRELIKHLLISQNFRCALSGLPLDIKTAKKTNHYSPSPDRIDSDGHYEKGNIQIVCQFINLWKSNQDDNEFKTLLKAVRSGK